MITEQDLRSAIAECQGQREPNANTCIKLAAYYTLLDHLFGEADDTAPNVTPSYSYAEPPRTIVYTSGSEFGEAIHGKNFDEIFPILDEMMGLVHLSNPRLYNAVLDKIADVR